jgi:undecaprenyl-diphosphatase
MKLMPIVFAFAVAAMILWRWARLGWPARLAAAALSGALALYGAGVFHLPELEKVVGSVGSTLGPYTYALVGVMAFLETGAFVGLLAPGETVVIVGGVVAGQGHIDLVALLGLTWICAFAGDLTGYALGRRLGRRFLLEHGPRVHITEARLIRVEAFFARLRTRNDSHRAIRRPGPGDRAVPRRRVPIPGRPVRRGCGRGHRLVERGVRAPGLCVLAVVR